MYNGRLLRIFGLIVGVVLFSIQIVSLFHEGYASFDTQPINGWQDRVTNSSFTKLAEPRNGDVIDWRRLTVAQRSWWYTDSTPNESERIPVMRNGRIVDVTIVDEPYRPTPHDLVTFIIPNLLWKLGFLLIGILVLLKGRGASAIYLAIMCIAWSVSGNSQWYSIVPLGTRLPFSIFLDILFVTACAAYYLFVDAVCAPTISQRTSRALRILVFFLLGIRLLVATVSTLTYIYSGYSPLFKWLGIPQTLVFLLGMGYSFHAYRVSSGLARRRFAWVFLSCLGLAGPCIANLTGAIGLTFGRWTDIVSSFTDYSVIIMAFGCAYVVLKHHVADVTIVINRALVYGILTAIVIAVLSLTEHIIGQLAVGQHRNPLLELLVPLVLGMGMHPLRMNVERVVDRVFNVRRRRTEELVSFIENNASNFDTCQALLGYATRRVHEVFGGTIATYLSRRNGLAKVVNEGPRQMPNFVAATRELTALCDVSGVVIPLELRSRQLGAIILALGESTVPIDAKELAALWRVARILAVESHVVRTIRIPSPTSLA